MSQQLVMHAGVCPAEGGVDALSLVAAVLRSAVPPPLGVLPRHTATRRSWWSVTEKGADRELLFFGLFLERCGVLQRLLVGEPAVASRSLLLAMRITCFILGLCFLTLRLHIAPGRSERRTRI